MLKVWAEWNKKKPCFLEDIMENTLNVIGWFPSAAG